MEMSHDVIDAIWRPTFVFKHVPLRTQLLQHRKTGRIGPVPWVDSALNPKNRVVSLPARGASRWRIDGAIAFKTRFFAIPLDLLETDRLVPLRIDVFVPDQSDYSPALRQSLDAATAVPVQNSAAVAGLGISRHLCQALEHHCTRNRDFLNRYQRLPFGSRIIVRNISTNIPDMEIDFEPNYDLERRATSLPELQRLWAQDIAPEEWPPNVDIQDLRLVQQIHDSVSLVRVRYRDIGVSDPAMRDHLAIFKSGTDEFDHVLHELRLLLTMPPHPHIMRRPFAIITKKCAFGGKLGVFGFLIPFLPIGSLRDFLPAQERRGALTATTKLKWSMQLTSALLHIREQGRTFYSDLRPDNVLLASNGNATTLESFFVVLCDFEQRGNWHDWCPPEILYPQYVENISRYQQRHAASRWESLIESYNTQRDRVAAETFVQSRNRPWFSLSKENQEKAMVYTLGLFFYCVFEGVSTVSAQVAHAFPYDPDVSFPEFRHTPSKMRDIIKWCTANMPWWAEPKVTKTKKVVRIGGLLYPEGETHLERDTVKTAEAVLGTAQHWWEAELDRAKDFFSSAGWQDKNLGDNRPSLKEVMHALKDFEIELDTSSARLNMYGPPNTDIQAT
ncbi:CBL-interacting serine/threonine-protein kinase [Diplogelasinospora grovesii]|uniref:CBL-interacting serine/threonine-protein kinase n=1 Tax=Diplogelasinospora grovesii TaxID=303347 RepID=A0AAN6MXG0_9PEZI|nr:CBL-interacting serine/threonine-protein kinase [Diplogelasinospora grovesii]